MKTKVSFLLLLVVMTVSCTTKQPSLKEVFSNDFLIGTSMDSIQILGRDAKAEPLIARQFNSVTAENAMKWENIHPSPDVYDFSVADSMVSFALKNNMFIAGHTLVWHSQTPDWVFSDTAGNPVDRETLLARMKDHIYTVVGHYRGKVGGWDVVNEALDEDGSLRHTKWLDIIGEDYIEKAFEYAHEADPDAELYYNDYNIELPGKRNGALALIQNLKEKGIKIDGVGIQGHWHLDSPDTSVIDESIREFRSTGLKVLITEFEINVLPTPPEVYGADISQQAAYLETLNPYASGLPDSVSTALADRYAGIFSVFLKNKGAVSRVTFWGVNDAYSWKNDWPIKGRTNYPLLFDRNYKPKAAFYSVIREAEKMK